MAIQITDEWIIDLPADYQRRVEDEKLIFWKTGITVIVVAYRLPESTGKLELLNKIQQKIPQDALETLVSTKGKIAGLGYTQIQNLENDIKRLALYTFTTSDVSCLQVAFYLDNPDDLPWAKSVWETIIYHPKTNAVQST
jgi:hypothetical protein